MKHWLCVYAGLLIGCWALPSSADIYVWTDRNGVKHFTNYSPPDKASIFMMEPKIASISASVEKRSDSERLQEAEKKIDDLNEEVTALKQQLEKQRQSKDESKPPDDSEPSEGEGVTEYDPYHTSDGYERYRYNGFSYGRTYKRYGYSGYRHRGHYKKHHYGYYYPKKYKYRHHKKHHRHYKSHPYLKYRQHHGKHRIVLRRHGHSIKHHRSGRHAGFRMGVRHRR
jgi:hypothetical protein